MASFISSTWHQTAVLAQPTILSSLPLSNFKKTVARHSFGSSNS